MADGSLIEWTDATWNPIVGCSVISPGCTNCYAMRLAGTRLKNSASRKGLTRDSKAGPVWSGEIRFMEEWLHQPLRWTRPRNIFVCAHSDLFHDGVTDEWRDEIFAMMARASWHRYQVLTKRADRMARYLLDPDTRRRISDILGRRCGFDSTPMIWPMPHVWPGISAETNHYLQDRIMSLTQLSEVGWHTWASLEPLLGPLDVSWALGILEWIVVGGESGPGARPMHPEWVRLVRDQCEALHIPFFFKQWGEWREFDHGSADYEVEVESDTADAILACAVNAGWITRDGDFYRRQQDLPVGVPCRLMERVGKKAAGAVLDGREWREMPAL